MITPPGETLIMKCGTDTQSANLILFMSTETAAPGTDVSTVTRNFFENHKGLFFAVPVFTCAFVVLAGSTLLFVASPEPGSFVYAAVGVTMVGSVVGGSLGTVTVIAASFVVPDAIPEPGF
jgi:hypothetical protein